MTNAKTVFEPNQPYRLKQISRLRTLLLSPYLDDFLDISNCWDSMSILYERHLMYEPKVLYLWGSSNKDKGT